MLQVALAGFPTLKFNELQIKKYLSQNDSFINQGLSLFQELVIIKS